MKPSELNLAIAAITNHFYENMTHEDFVNLGLLLSLISKDILSMAAIEGLCAWRKEEERRD